MSRSRDKKRNKKRIGDHIYIQVFVTSVLEYHFLPISEIQENFRENFRNRGEFLTNETWICFVKSILKTIQYPTQVSQISFQYCQPKKKQLQQNNQIPNQYFSSLKHSHLPLPLTHLTVSKSPTNFTKKKRENKKARLAPLGLIKFTKQEQHSFSLIKKKNERKNRMFSVVTFTSKAASLSLATYALRKRCCCFNGAASSLLLPPSSFGFSAVQAQGQNRKFSGWNITGSKFNRSTIPPPVSHCQHVNC